MKNLLPELTEVELMLGINAIHDLNQYCEKDNIKIIDRLIKENKRLRQKIEEISLEQRKTLDYFNV
tara:strand:+ start:1381 stop:1578 length:198 start_codon:yes stop_codon:yes gene_type:complete